MNIRYRVELSAAEHCELNGLLSAGKHPARKLKRAQILLAADAGISDEDIAISVAVQASAEATAGVRGAGRPDDRRSGGARQPAKPADRCRSSWR